MQLRKQLEHIGIGLRRRELAGALLLGALLFAGFFLSATLLGRPVSEGNIALFGCIAISLSAILAIYGIMRSQSRHRNPDKMAALVEEMRPHYMDSFATAVQLEALKRPLRPIESELMEDVRTQLAKENRSLASLFPGCRLVSSLWRLLLAAVLISMGTHSLAWRDFQEAVCAIISGDCGIAIDAPEAEVPMHADYTISDVQIKRGPCQGEIIWRSKEDSGRSPLNTDASGRLFFTFYDMTEDIEYRIVTPRLRSPMYKVRAYEPPALKALRISAQPPPYSGLAKTVQNDNAKLNLLEGSAISVSIQAEAHIGARLHLPQKEIMPISEKDGDWRSSMPVAVHESGICRIELNDAEGHSRHIAFELELIKDQPPEITLLQPGDDTFVKQGQGLRIAANVADDFGISSLKLDYSISGGEHRTLAFPPQDEKKEWDVSMMWELDKLKLEAGDIISCQLLAEDNREPIRNAARSSLFFVTVRPDKNDEAQSDSQNGNEQKEASVSDLVAEAKRLLRLNWDLRHDAKERDILQFQQSISALEKETNVRHKQLKEMAGGPLGAIGMLFEQTATALHSAAAMVGRKLLEEAVPFQERALASLVAIETELVKNSMKSKSSSKQYKEGEGKGEQQRQEEQSKGEDGAGDDLRAIQEAIEEIKRLIVQQGDLNVAIRGEKPQSFALSGRQRKIQQETDAVRQRIFPVKNALEAANVLNMAGGDMAGADNALASAKCDIAGHYGDRAQQRLQQARHILEALLKQAAAQQMQTLSEKADELAQRQEEAAGKSRENTGDSGQLRQQQKDINSSTSQMMQDLRGLGSEMQKLSPETAKDINQALSKAISGGLEDKQRQAQRSLAYKRMKRAADEQEQAADLLRKMSKDLKNALKTMHGLNEQELRQALQQLAGLAAEANAAEKDKDAKQAQQRLKQIRRQAAEITGRIGKAAQSKELQRTSGELSKESDDTPYDSTSTIKQIASAVYFMAQMLSSFQPQKQQNIRRTYIAPPEKYRKQVENYFKEISKE